MISKTVEDVHYSALGGRSPFSRLGNRWIQSGVYRETTYRIFGVKVFVSRIKSGD